jgi:hypothetical protein
VTSASAASSADATRLRWRTGTTVAATTSVRLAVAPPARKNRRRTRPVTTTSVPASSAATALGASNQTTGTDSAGRPSARVVTSKAVSWSPDGSSRASGGRDSAPRTMTTFMWRS